MGGLLRALDLEVPEADDILGLRGRKYGNGQSQYSKKGEDRAEPGNGFHLFPQQMRLRGLPAAS